MPSLGCRAGSSTPLYKVLSISGLATAFWRALRSQLYLHARSSPALACRRTATQTGWSAPHPLPTTPLATSSLRPATAAITCSSPLTHQPPLPSHLLPRSCDIIICSSSTSTSSFRKLRTAPPLTCRTAVTTCSAVPHPLRCPLVPTTSTTPATAPTLTTSTSASITAAAAAPWGRMLPHSYDPDPDPSQQQQQQQQQQALHPHRAHAAPPHQPHHQPHRPHQPHHPQQQQRPPNRLAAEQSPYLLQHAHNPVDWFPWGAEAFSRAAAADKPIFLSVGYATCHWCHVMERESFQDEEVAQLLNSHFIAVKVDREERPDVDRLYMTYVQAVSGSGGWPMSVWLTPSLEPFYGGTYFPPKDRFAGGVLVQPGFPTVLRRIASLWGAKRQDVKGKAALTMAQLTEALAPHPPSHPPHKPSTSRQQQHQHHHQASPAGPSTAAASAASAASATSSVDAAPLSPPSSSASPSSSSSSTFTPFSPALAAAAVEACAADLARRYDAEWGGFGGAPKFPRPSELNLLLRAQLRHQELGDTAGSGRLRRMALHSLGAMAAGGLYDQIGGGFHRYSVDELWHVPHFEKMLYDNPQLAATYLAAVQLTGEDQYARVARGVLDYLLRDLSSPQGGLYSAEDADSPDPRVASRQGGGLQEEEGQPGGYEGVGVGGGAGGGGEEGEAERKEGAFYLWDVGEIHAVLGPDLGALFCLVYGIEEEGNCSRSDRSDPHGEFEGLNVPYLAVPPGEAARRLGLGGEGGGEMSYSGKGEEEGEAGGEEVDVERWLAEAREALHAVRAARPRPALDDKIVTAWNGLAIGAFALAGRVLAGERPDKVQRLFPSEGRPPAHYLATAQRIAGFVRQHLWLDGRLRRSYCRGQPSAVQGFADDYAALVSGLLDLFECGGGRQWLEWAVQLQAVQDELFWDEQSGGYFATTHPASPGADPSIRIRIKDDYDGAEPAASSLAAANLLRLAEMLPQRPTVSTTTSSTVATTATAGRTAPQLMSYDETANRTLAAFSSRLSQSPLSVPQLCCAAHSLSKRPFRQVIIAGQPGAPDTSALLDAVHSCYCPDKVVLLVDPADPRDMRFWAAHNPSVHHMVAAHFAAPASAAASSTAPLSSTIPPAATAFICQCFTCQAPTGDPARVRELLGRVQTPPSTAQLAQLDLKL
ncbi:hypothetical protein Agub_g14278 [Astrephomene gubernaculifera]|uniref:Spermatogenesis-associated protein 20-like TRX domain-containing protein n=1 Tax=Astrephomene gubernaculifera TaxID=47775 RepID=A0AAD3E302_9CHLO|nr:hypothetical protein Agub_g14278 [Astrephomene gubernaculifera]